jgi:hypothetical protein
MNRACGKNGGSPMPITFLRLLLNRGYPVSLAIPKPRSSDSPDGKKNSLRSLRYDTLDFFTTGSPAWSVTHPVATRRSTSNWRSGVYCAEGAAR